MGVPKFFRYISERYPCLSSIVKDYEIPDFDNLYLDMNGIIHPCSHPNDEEDDLSGPPTPSLSEAQIFQNIFNYLEQLFRLIKPKKLFFMAVDGVAPRAKMNQQRSRRFRTAAAAIAKKHKRQQLAGIVPNKLKLYEDHHHHLTGNTDKSNEQTIQAVYGDSEFFQEFHSTSVEKKQELISKTVNNAADTFEDDYFDSNCITPGTKFMTKLHEKLVEFIQLKISNDSLWKNVKVILSGHNTPGEGEHKIMDYIRYLKSTTKDNSKIKHCLYGLDADLIILGLCTHEYNFCLLREEVNFGRKVKKSAMATTPEHTRFYLLHLTLLREYIEIEFSPLKEKLVDFQFDLEKIIDDWVLLGFLVGNDFIPNLPNLHISNNVLPRLYKIYMECLPTLDGYINESGTLNLVRFEKFMKFLAQMDVEHFDNIFDDILYMELKTGVRNYGAEFTDDDGEEEIPSKDNDDQLTNLEICHEYAKDDKDDNESYETSKSVLKYFEIYKRKYYLEKLDIPEVTSEILKQQAQDYVCAIQWILNYYYTGICSWSWYYAQHYAPFISDIKDFAADLEKKQLDFDLGQPFKPFEQLLAVLPPASKALLPEAYHSLILSKDSPLREYYPADFQTDLNGKVNDWEAVVLLPFIDEELLLKSMKPCNARLTIEETNRNQHGPMVLYEYDGNDGPTSLRDIINSNKASVKRCIVKATPMDLPKISKAETLLILRNSIQRRDLKFSYSPGFPTLKLFNFTHELQKAKVRVFDQPSRYDNVILTIGSEEKEDIKIPYHLLGATVYVNYPHLIEAKIIAISSREKLYIYQGGNLNTNEETGDEKSNYCFVLKDTTENMFNTKCSNKIAWYRERLGINIVNTNIICEVQFLIGKKYGFPSGIDGKENKEKLIIEKQYSKTSSHYPLQIIVTKDMLNENEEQESDGIYSDSFIQTIDIFPKDSICFLLCSPNYGYPAMVLSKTPDLSGRIQVKVLKQINEDLKLNLAEEIESQNFMNLNYRNVFHASCQLGMSNYVFARITGSIYISLTRNDDNETQRKINIGLQLKLIKQNKETPNYTRKIANNNNNNNGNNNPNNCWYYSEKCIELVREYSMKFPEVFQYLSRLENNESDKYGTGNNYAEDIFGTDKCHQRMDDLKAWINKIPTKSIERQYPNSYLSDETIQYIENILNSSKETSVPFAQIAMKIKPCFLYSPQLNSNALLPDPNMTEVELYDRIIHVRMGSVVPFALKGIVVGIVPAAAAAASAVGNDLDATYDVIFDEPFQQYGVGTSSDSTNTSRRYRLPKSAFLNISLGRRHFEKKTGKISVPLHVMESLKRHSTTTTSEKLFTRLTRELGGKKEDNQLPKAIETKNIPSGSAFASFLNNSNNGKLTIMTVEKNETVKSEDKDLGENKEKSEFLKSLLNIGKERQMEKQIDSKSDGNNIDMTVPPIPPETWMSVDPSKNSNNQSRMDSNVLNKLFIPTQVMKKSPSTTSTVHEKNTNLDEIAFENLKIQNDDLLTHHRISTSSSARLDDSCPRSVVATTAAAAIKTDNKTKENRNEVEMKIRKRKSRIAAKFNVLID